MFWLTFTHPFITAHLFWLNLSWEFKNYIHPVHENGRISEALTCFRLIHCNFKELEQMNYFPSRRGMSEAVHQILLGTLEILSLKTYMETLNQHRFQSHPKLTRRRQDFQVWAPSWFSSVGACTQMNTQHTVTKLLGQPQQRDCKDLHLSPCSRGSTAPVLPWPCGGGRFLHNPPSPAAHTPLPGVCHRKNEQH